MSNREFIFVRTGGAHRDIGIDVGKATREIVQELIADNPHFYKKTIGRSIGTVKAYVWKNFLPFMRRFFNDYVEELRGLAEGAAVSFEDLLVFSAEEELMDLWGGHWDRCSSAAVRARSGFFLLHNEDYLPRYRGRLLVVEAAPAGGQPAFLSLSYPGTLAGSSCGLNDAGLAIGGNSLHFRPRRRGLPKNFISRDILAATSIDDAERRMCRQPRVAGGNIGVVSARENRAINVETSPKECVRIEMGESDVLAHTNHVRSPAMDARGEKASRSSRQRLAGIEYLLEKKRNRATPAYLKSVLSSRRHHLLCTDTRPKSSFTLASVVMDPGRKKMHVANRAARGSIYVEYRLNH